MFLIYETCKFLKGNIMIDKPILSVNKKEIRKVELNPN